MQMNAADIGPHTNMTITVVLNRQRPSYSTSKMDISTFLNPSDEQLYQQSQPMDLDSPSTICEDKESSDSSASLSNSASTSPRPFCTHCYPHRLPPMQTNRPTSAQRQLRSDNTLPPLRFLLQNLAPPTLKKLNKQDFCSPIAMEEGQKNARLNVHPARVHYSRSTEGIAQTSHDYQTPSVLLDLDPRSGLSRRRFHHSTPRSPHSPHHRIMRRRSHPQPVWSVPIHRAPGSHPNQIYQSPPLSLSDPSSHNDSSSLVSKLKTTHNNKPYTIEMIDWIRYHKADRGMSFKTDMLPLFFAQFPERYDPGATEQILSSRMYRDNNRPVLDENGNWGLDEKGGLRVTDAKVRDQTTTEGKELDVPYALVDRAPWRVLSGRYDHWKSPILEEDRSRARAILAGEDPCDVHGKRAEWRRIFRETEHLIYKMQPDEH